MTIYLATNETPQLWMLVQDNKTVDPIEAQQMMFELDNLKATSFVWIEETKRFQPLRSYSKGNKPKIQDFKFIIKWDL
jgi:hypothetical protein